MHRPSLTCLALILLAAVTAGQPHRREVLSSGEGPAFQCQIGQRLGRDPDSLRLLVAMSIPYDNLSFVRSDEGGFRASFDYTVTVFEEEAELPIERSQRVEVPAATFRLTNSRTEFVTRSEEFTVRAGEHRVRVTLTDLESKETSRWRGKIEMVAGDSLLDVSDIYWVSEDESPETFGEPRLAESFLTTEAQATARVEYYSAGDYSFRLF